LVTRDFGVDMRCDERFVVRRTAGAGTVFNRIWRPSPEFWSLKFFHSITPQNFFYFFIPLFIVLVIFWLGVSFSRMSSAIADTGPN
jgi:hypothetical protein